MAQNSMRLGTPFLTLTLVLVAALALLSTPVVAQNLTGQISGLILDPTGKTVPDATVVLTNQETQQQRTVATDQEGRFLFTQLLRGTYTLTITAPGFKQLKKENVVLTATERLVLRDSILEVGNVTQSVLVTAEAARVATESSERAGVVTSTQIQQLPTKGRDIMDVVRTLP
ncbi:MAG TPA: carboxypeptidase-like regulatory domain-containing protein, partial [Bryobacteraceae bacterium]|nr:carboxypeptidase-like regulatory domain-containing protein [Bryobacteraceae bacterium]